LGAESRRADSRRYEMCGIAGIVGSLLPPAEMERRLRSASDAMVHRGPDEGRIFLLPSDAGAFAVRRLALIDLDGGSQPLTNEDGSIVVAFNGEIYNYRELRRELVRDGHRFATSSDTEVLVHLYEERGDGFLAALDGMFALALWDHRRGRLILARDRLGMKPLYWTQTAKGLLFGSEIRALLATGLVTARPDLVALDEALTVGWVAAPRSGFAGIQKLRAGGFLVCERGVVRTGVHWRPSFETLDRSPADAADELERRLREAVASHLHADVPVGAFLSGGIDSSLLVAIAAEVAPRRLRTFSLVFPEDAERDESRHSRAVARAVGSDHSEIELRAEDLVDLLPRMVESNEEPFSASPGALVHRLSASAGREVKAVLAGEGADELFAGYPWAGRRALERVRQWAPRRPLAWASQLVRDPFHRARLRMMAADRGTTADLEYFRGLTADQKRELLLPGLQTTEDLDALAIAPEVAATCRDVVARRTALDLTGRLADGLLLESDKLAMAHSLEVRLPYLARGVVDLALSLPSRLKAHHGEEKIILRRVARRRLPASVTERRKFALRYPDRLGAAVREHLLGSSAAGPFRREALERVVPRWLGREDRHSRALVTLLVVHLWWRRFFGDAGIDEFMEHVESVEGQDPDLERAAPRLARRATR
jgi:asparagine synthase (glutamine-hydrolysing)